MRIGIVNHDMAAVDAIRRALAAVPHHHVAWIAGDGGSALERCSESPPDLVLMDLALPVMDGIEATRRIMRECPSPVLVVTASVGINAARVSEAMGVGALDAVDTPVVAAGEDWAAAFLTKIDSIGRIIAPVAHQPAAGESDVLVAIGASAGGPAALAELLGALPADLPASIVIVQHIDERFAPGMVSWLQPRVKLPIRLAHEGDAPEAGRILVAGGSSHLVFRGSRRLGYTVEPRETVYRPSIDVFFDSAADCWTADIVGVLLTGMGRDGASGLKKLRAKGHHTIAQNEATSIVYGMPKAAAAMGAAAEVLALDAIAPRLVQRICARAAAERTDPCLRLKHRK